MKDKRTKELNQYSRSTKSQGRAGLHSIMDGIFHLAYDTTILVLRDKVAKADFIRNPSTLSGSDKDADSHLSFYRQIRHALLKMLLLRKQDNLQ
jgi:hypothetical protein